MKLSRRQFLAGLGTVGGLAAAGGIGRYIIGSNRRRHKPNIVLFIADDMRSSAAGFAGNKIIRTPRLDALAAQACVFDNHFVTTSICPTSRASIMCGEYALRHGVYDFKAQMTQQSFFKSFPYLLKKDGYTTGYIGKWGMGGAKPIPYFDMWHGYENLSKYYPLNNIHMTDAQTHLALDFLKRRPSRSPFLLVVSYKAPHSPFTPQHRFEQWYNDVAIPRAASDTDEGGDIPGILSHTNGRVQYVDRILSDAQYQQQMKQYYRLISGIDESVGIIMDALKEQGADDMTSVLFTSDNGMMMGEHRMMGKWVMYEESIRTPLVVRPAKALYPDISPARMNAMSLNVDIAPTILDMAALPLPAHIQGQSLVPVMGNPQTPWREGFYYEHPFMPQLGIVACEGYRGRKWKYTRYGLGKESEECLFDLENDPLELSNLANYDRFSGEVEQMQLQMLAEKTAMLAL